MIDTKVSPGRKLAGTAFHIPFSEATVGYDLLTNIPGHIRLAEIPAFQGIRPLCVIDTKVSPGSKIRWCGVSLTIF